MKLLKSLSALLWAVLKFTGITAALAFLYLWKGVAVLRIVWASRFIRRFDAAQEAQRIDRLRNPSRYSLAP